MQRKKPSKAKGPDLLLVVPCVRSIIADDDNLVSLIDILQDVTISAKEAAVVKPTEIKLIPSKWEIVTIWRRAASETRTFVQILQFLDPTGKKLFNHEQEFLGGGPNHRIRLRCKGMPITIPGEYLIKVFSRPLEGKRKSEVGQYPLNVVFSDAPLSDA